MQDPTGGVVGGGGVRIQFTAISSLLCSGFDSFNLLNYFMAESWGGLSGRTGQEGEGVELRCVTCEKA
jgi:hypothetical protein